MICAHEFRTRHEHTEYVLMPEQGGHARLVAQSPRCLRRPGARLVVQSPRSHPFRGAPPLKGCGTPSRVRHPFRGAAPLEGRRTPDAAPQGVRAAACGKPLQSSSGSRGSAGRGFLRFPRFRCFRCFSLFFASWRSQISQCRVFLKFGA